MCKNIWDLCTPIRVIVEFRSKQYIETNVNTVSCNDKPFTQIYKHIAQRFRIKGRVIGVAPRRYAMRETARLKKMLSGAAGLINYRLLVPKLPGTGSLFSWAAAQREAEISQTWFTGVNKTRALAASNWRSIKMQIHHRPINSKHAACLARTSIFVRPACVCEYRDKAWSRADRQLTILVAEEKAKNWSPEIVSRNITSVAYLRRISDCRYGPLAFKVANREAKGDRGT